MLIAIVWPLLITSLVKVTKTQYLSQQKGTTPKNIRYYLQQQKNLQVMKLQHSLLINITQLPTHPPKCTHQIPIRDIPSQHPQVIHIIQRPVRTGRVVPHCLCQRNLRQPLAQVLYLPNPPHPINHPVMQPESRIGCGGFGKYRT